MGKVKAKGVYGLVVASKNVGDDVPIHMTGNNDSQKLDIQFKGEQQVGETALQGSVLKVDNQALGDYSITCSRRKRQSSCPMRAAHSINLGPWSIEWLQDQVYGDVGVVCSSKQYSKIKLSTQAISSKIVEDDTMIKEVKTSIKLKHYGRNIKKNCSTTCQ